MCANLSVDLCLIMSASFRDHYTESLTKHVEVRFLGTVEVVEDFVQAILIRSVA